MAVKYWIVAGVLYVALVIVSYSVITGEDPLKAGERDHDQHHEESKDRHDQHHEESNDREESADSNDEEGDDKHVHHDTTLSEVDTDVSYEDGVLRIELSDELGEAPELLENHTKQMHLIIVSNDLEDFIHLHPEQLEEGSFAEEVLLNDGYYNAFVDIDPKEKKYTPEANQLIVGDTSSSSEPAHLVLESSLTKERAGQKVALDASGLVATQTARLTFDLHGEEPKPYLGALGHVVILDEAAETFIHVHPVSEREPIFEAYFKEPGLYKLWAEFKFEEAGVQVFSFVIEVS